MLFSQIPPANESPFAHPENETGRVGLVVLQFATLSQAPDPPEGTFNVKDRETTHPLASSHGIIGPQAQLPDESEPVICQSGRSSQSVRMSISAAHAARLSHPVRTGIAVAATSPTSAHAIEETVMKHLSKG